MKTAQKKKLAEMLLPLLIKQGLKALGCLHSPVLVDDIEETEDFLERMGYEFITRRSIQTNPRDTPKKVHLEMIGGPAGWYKNTPIPNGSVVIWICIDADIALKALVLGGFPETTHP